jgi:predicted anti-sigma-YlaC factor YlaD
MAILGLIMTCRECDEFIVSYLDGTLTPRQQFLFKTHMALCKVCRDYLEDYKQTIAITQSAAKKMTPSPGMPDELVQAILAAKRDTSEQNEDPSR